MSVVRTRDLEPVVDIVKLRVYLREQACTRWPDRLQFAMKTTKCSAAQLAARSGTTPQTIDKVLKGQIVPREYLRVAIACALGAEVADLFPLPSWTDIAKAVAAA